MKLALLMMSLSGCATVWTSGQEAPNHGATPTPVVNAWLNGEGPFELLVDTGAQTCVVSESVADRLHLSWRGEIVLHGVGTTKGSVAVIDHVGVAGVVADNVPCVVVTLSGLDGLLGNAFLRAYRVTLDYPRRHLTLDPAAR